MVCNLKYKKMICVLILGIILITVFLWHREETINKKIPKRAEFVKLYDERIKFNG